MGLFHSPSLTRLPPRYDAVMQWNRSQSSIRPGTAAGVSQLDRSRVQQIASDYWVFCCTEMGFGVTD